MAERSHRTDTGFFIALLVILVGAIVWVSANRSTPAAGPAAPAPMTTNPDVTTQSATASNPDWTGELILVRENVLVGRTGNGVERTIYTAPSDSSISGATDLAGDHTLVALTGATNEVLDVNVRTGATSERSDLPNVQLTALRPTTTEVARVTFSNAERSFGSTVGLIDKDASRALYQASGATVTALAWRADGDALALGTQTGVIVVPLTSGDAQPIELGSPVRSLSWGGGVIFAVTDKVGVVEITPGAKGVPPSISTTLGEVGRDFLSFAPDRFVWLRASSAASDVVATTVDSGQYRANQAQPVTVTQASRLLGFIQ